MQAPEGLLYRLMATVVHTGLTTKSGHYVAYRRVEDADAATADGAGRACAWELWNDSVISAATWEDVATAPTYMAFYEIVNASALRAVFPQTRPVLSAC